jgi:hypothetical protein
VPTLKSKVISTKLKKFKPNSWCKTISSKTNRINWVGQMLQAKFKGIKMEVNLKIRATFPIRKVTTSQRVKILKKKLRFLKSVITTIIIWSWIWIYRSNIPFLILRHPLKSISNLPQLIIRNKNKVSKAKVLYLNKRSKVIKIFYKTKMKIKHKVIMHN